MSFGERMKISAINTEALWHRNYGCYPQQATEANKWVCLQKKEGETQRFIVDGWQTSLYLTGVPRASTPGLFMLLEKTEKEKIYMGKLETNNAYRSL